MNIAEFAKGMGIHVEQYVIPSNMEPVEDSIPLVIHATEGIVVNDPCPACGQPVPNSDLGCDCPHCGHEGQLPDSDEQEPFTEEPVEQPTHSVRVLKDGAVEMATRYGVPGYTVYDILADYFGCGLVEWPLGCSSEEMVACIEAEGYRVEINDLRPQPEQPVVVVVTVSGGVADVAYTPGINVVIVDFDNIDAGDSATDVLSELSSEGVSLDNPPADLADTVKCLRDYALEQKLES